MAFSGKFRERLFFLSGGLQPHKVWFLHYVMRRDCFDPLTFGYWPRGKGPWGTTLFQDTKQPSDSLCLVHRTDGWFLLISDPFFIASLAMRGCFAALAPSFVCSVLYGNDSFSRAVGLYSVTTCPSKPACKSQSWLIITSPGAWWWIVPTCVEREERYMEWQAWPCLGANHLFSPCQFALVIHYNLR